MYLLFPAIAFAYFFGVMNDNLFKQTTSFLVIQDNMEYLQGVGTILFSIPFILLSAYAGWAADNLNKTSVVFYAKVCELAIVLLGCVGLLINSYLLMLIVVLLFAIQSTFFSPTLNSILPLVYKNGEELANINGRIKLTTTIASLLGIALSGFLLEANLLGDTKYNIIILMLFSSIVGIYGTVLIKRISVNIVNFEHSTRSAFPWKGPLDSLLFLIHIYKVKNYKMIFTLWNNSFFYFSSVVAIQLISSFSNESIGFTKTQTSIINLFMLLGVGFGSWLSGRRLIISSPSWSIKSIKYAALMGILLLIPAVSTSFYLILIVALLAGAAGGGYLVPLATYIQYQPEPSQKGRVIALSYFLSFSFMSLSGLVYIIIINLVDANYGLAVLGSIVIINALLNRLIFKIF